MIAKNPVPDNYLTHSRGIASWLFTLDHKRIGVMYLGSILTALFLAGVFAMIIRLQLLIPTGLLFHKTATETTQKVYELYNQTFTLHGAIMVFMVLIPGIPAALGNFVLPIMLGAKDVAFPRLNLASYYFYVGGAVFMLSSLALNGVDTGWTFYTPYSIRTATSVIAVVFGVFLLGFSSIFTGLNFMVTIHKLRPTGMTWFRIPLFAWGIYSTALFRCSPRPCWP